MGEVQANKKAKKFVHVIFMALGLIGLVYGAHQGFAMARGIEESVVAWGWLGGFSVTLLPAIGIQMILDGYKNVDLG